jgi:RHS repeat-associated protein
MYYRHSDWLGSNRLTSTATAPTSRYFSTAYAPFGEQYATSGTADASFTGQDQETVSSLYDFLARRQSPSQGRWVSPDPAGRGAVTLTKPQSWNRYAYVLNNPLSLVDPLGLDDCWGGGDCTMKSDDGGGGGGTVYIVDGVEEPAWLGQMLLGTGAGGECPNDVCSGFNENGDYEQFVAGAGGAAGYVKFSDLTQGINEWNGTFYSNTQFQAQVINPAVDSQRWALAQAIAAQNGGDVNLIYQQLTYIKTVGGNADFNPGNIDLSFLDSSQDNRGGDVHLHPDGLIHLDSFNPFSSFPFGAFGHFFVDLLIGNINSSVPFPR